MAEEESLKRKLQELQKQLGKKESFQEAVSAIKTVLIENYMSASPSLKKSIYAVVCRVATILQTRYTSPGFWLAGKGLFEEAEHMASSSTEREHLNHCIAKASEHLHDVANQPDVSESAQNRGSRYLFEGHLTVDTEPPRPTWLVASDVLNNVFAETSDGRREGTAISADTLMQELANIIGSTNMNIDEAIEASLQEIGAGPRRVPPASKEVVRKLPIISVTEEILSRLGKETECAVCREELVVNDKMQELPCKHLFHSTCLKPWLDENNSCPICRSELPTDDHVYESQKERDKEDAEERKGAANAVRGGEFMYV